MGDEINRTVRCSACRTLLDEPTDIGMEDRHPCPECGSLARLVELEAADEIRFRSAVKLTGKRRGLKRPFLELFTGADQSRASGQWMEKLRRIDRDHDRYIEVVTNPETGEVIHQQDEPLSHHRRHGSDKRSM